jgi:hypothetical protein
MVEGVRHKMRWWATALFVLVFIPTCVALLSEFFIELGKEYGVYDKPSARLAATVTAVSNFVSQPWFLICLGTMAGFVAGVWFDTILRRIEAARNARQLEKPPPRHAGAEPGLLDFMVEGQEALASFRKALQGFNSVATDAGHVMMRYAPLLSKQSDPRKMREMAATMASELEDQAAKFERHVGEMESANVLVRNNLAPMVAMFDTETTKGKSQLADFAKTVILTRDTVAGTAQSAVAAAGNVDTLQGSSRELNSASKRISAAIGAYHKQSTLFLMTCDGILHNAEERLAKAGGTTQS